MLEGTHRQLININSGLCMDLLADTGDSTSLVQRPCGSSATQDFRFGQLGSGVLTIRSTYNRALMPEGAARSNGVSIIQSTVTGATAEQFVFEPYGTGVHRDLLETATAVYSLKVAHTGMAIGVARPTLDDDVPVVQEPYVATDDRFHWYVTQLGTVLVKGIAQTTYQIMNRRTGKCLDLDGTTPRRFVQRTCSTAQNQRFMFTPTGNLRQVVYTSRGVTMDVLDGSTSAGAPVVEGPTGEGWQWHNMFTFEPILAIEPHRLAFSRQESGGPCGDYYWYDVTQPNGLVLGNPADTYVQLIFAGGKQAPSGPDLNPFISQQVSGNQVAIDPTYGLTGSGTTASGSCTASCLKVSLTNIAGQCCSCNGLTDQFAKSSWSATTFVCQ